MTSFPRFRRQNHSIGAQITSIRLRLAQRLERTRFLPAVLRSCAVAIAAATTALAFPPWNYEALAFVGIAAFALLTMRRSLTGSFLYGWLWGIVWTLMTFFWLREIHPVIPYLLAPVMGAYYGFFGLGSAFFYRTILLNQAARNATFSVRESVRNYSLLRQFLYLITLSALFVLLEQLRRGVFPWNFLAASQTQNLPLLQLARWTGSAGISFLIVGVNIAIALAILTLSATHRNSDGTRSFRYRRPIPLMSMLLALALTAAWGVRSMRRAQAEYQNFPLEYHVGVVQGDLSQRRNADMPKALEAIEIYADLTRTLPASPRADLIVWPESAVPLALRGAGGLNAYYRSKVRTLARDLETPLLIGTLEYDFPDSASPAEVGLLNSAVLLDSRDFLRKGYLAQYDKVHRVPFGEYIPMRKFLPKWAIRLIDMNRDLTPGKSLEPIRLNNKILCGVSICFEDVFPYVIRGEILRGANFLMVISNDAWYPTSSEPEQHLANALLRAIESNSVMLRSGNDSASVLIRNDGVILWSMSPQYNGEAPHSRGRGADTVTFRLPDQASRTLSFYTRHGEWFLLLCTIWVGVGALCGIAILLQDRKQRLIAVASLNKASKPEILP